MDDFPEENLPRRSPRRAALAPLDNTTIPNASSGAETRTPPISADEFIIEHRGRRRKPITWSPVDYNKTDLLGPPRDKTPERAPQRPEISSKLRRRLTMSPVKEAQSQEPQLGTAIAKKLKALSSTRSECNTAKKP